MDSLQNEAHDEILSISAFYGHKIVSFSLTGGQLTSIIPLTDTTGSNQ